MFSSQDIHQKVMSLDYGDFKAEIITVDSQDSLTGGVLVMVTGALSSQLRGKRSFVQSFFLAPQEKGYFVLNDIFRYLDDELEPELSKQSPIRAKCITEPVQGRDVPEPGTKLGTHASPFILYNATYFSFRCRSCFKSRNSDTWLVLGWLVVDYSYMFLFLFRIMSSFRARRSRDIFTRSRADSGGDLRGARTC